MKFNLKNRPITDIWHTKETANANIQELEEWFESFEKELRDRLKDLLDENGCLRHSTDTDEVCFIKDILGES